MHTMYGCWLLSSLSIMSPSSSVAEVPGELSADRLISCAVYSLDRCRLFKCDDIISSVRNCFVGNKFGSVISRSVFRLRTSGRSAVLLWMFGVGDGGPNVGGLRLLHDAIESTGDEGPTGTAMGLGRITALNSITCPGFMP
uniref:Putative secreted peptide n=1 Tax=Anopheles braziliensis TaxID=58242 RepID=A0A2M3ZSC8_9DIPT